MLIVFVSLTEAINFQEWLKEVRDECIIEDGKQNILRDFHKLECPLDSLNKQVDAEIRLLHKLSTKQ